MNEKECCPKFNPELWEGKTHVWKDKLFAKDSVCAFLHFPLGVTKAITRMCEMVEAVKAAPAPEEFLMLFLDPSPWRSEIRMSVTKNVPGLEMTTLSGTFVSRVFSGPYSSVPKWIKEMEAYLASQGQKAQEYHIHYAYCPKCSKKYGENYSVLFAKVA